MNRVSQYFVLRDTVTSAFTQRVRSCIVTTATGQIKEKVAEWRVFQLKPTCHTRHCSGAEL